MQLANRHFLRVRTCPSMVCSYEVHLKKEKDLFLGPGRPVINPLDVDHHHASLPRKQWEIAEAGLALTN